MQGTHIAGQGICNARWCSIEKPFAFTVGVFSIGKWVGLRLGNRYLVHREVDFE